jgi:hypothetical protein
MAIHTNLKTIAGQAQSFDFIAADNSSFRTKKQKLCR